MAKQILAGGKEQSLNEVAHYRMIYIPFDEDMCSYTDAWLGELYKKAVEEVGEVNAMIFEVHQMMLEDDDYNESIYNIIRNDSVNAEFAVATTGDNFSRMFAEMEDEYFKARAADVKDISERIVNVLVGATSGKDLKEPVILVADDLAPSETVQMDKSKLLAFVTLYPFWYVLMGVFVN